MANPLNPLNPQGYTQNEMGNQYAPPMPKQRPAISGVMEQQEKEIARLAGNVDVLIARLACVTNQVPPSPEKDCATAPRQLPDLLDTIRRNTDGIEHRNRMLETLLANLEL